MHRRKARHRQTNGYFTGGDSFFQLLAAGPLCLGLLGIIAVIWMSS